MLRPQIDPLAASGSQKVSLDLARNQTSGAALFLRVGPATHARFMSPGQPSDRADAAAYLDHCCGWIAHDVTNCGIRSFVNVDVANYALFCGFRMDSLPAWTR